jgi:hypothetical protein
MNNLIRPNTSTSINEVLTYNTTNGIIEHKDIASLVSANETNTTVTGLQTAGHTIGTINNEDNVPFVIKESVSVLGTPTLTGNVLTIPFTNETGVLSNVTVNLAQLALDVKVASVNYDPATQDIVITNSDGTSFTIDLTDLLQLIPTLTVNDDQANHLNGYNPLSQTQDFSLNFIAKGKTLSNFNNTSIANVPNNNIAFQNEIPNIFLETDYNANLIDTFQTLNCNYIIKDGCGTIDLERVQVYLDLLLTQDPNSRTVFLNFINQTGSEVRLRAWSGENILRNGTQGIRIQPYKSITVYPSYDTSVANGFIWYTTGEFEYTPLIVTSSANSLNFSNVYQNQSVPIINSNGLNLIGNTLKSTINGVDSNTIVLPIQATTHTVSSSVNTLTSVVNGVSVNAPIVNTNVVTVTGSNLSTTVNGVVSNIVALPTPVTTNVLSSNTASGIVSTVNGVQSTLTPTVGTVVETLGFNSLGTLVKTLIQPIADFFRSGTGTTLPDGTTDLTENIVRGGKTGLGHTDPSILNSTLDVKGTFDTRPYVQPANVYDFTNSGVIYKTTDIPNNIVDAESNIIVKGVIVDTVLNIGVPSTLTPAQNAQYVGRYLRIHNDESNTGKLLFKGYEILPHQFLDLQHNGRVWEYETGYLPNWQGFDLVSTPVTIPAFASGTTTYVDVPTAFVTLPTADDYLVKYTVYASQGSAIMPTKAGNDVKFVTDNTVGTFVEIVGSVSEIGNEVGGTINSYTRTFRVRKCS